MEAKVAIVIPTCDRGSVLMRACQSALMQQIPPHEVIVVNDGTSHTISVPSDRRIRVLRTSVHEGCAAARNLALRNLSPETNAIAYLDDDDELMSNHVRLLSEAIENGASFAFSRAIYKHPNGMVTDDPEPANTGPKRYYDPNALLIQNVAPVSCFMHRREAGEAIGGFDEALLRMEDWDFWGRMAITHGKPWYVHDMTNVIHKDQAENMTTANYFSYSLCCSWRDIVSDRLKWLSGEKRGTLTPEEAAKFNAPKIAVLIPVYNAEKHLREAMDSIMAQTCQDFEVVAINDGSTDSSREILSSYGAKVRIFDMPKNQGVTKALNYGLLVSRSKYIARMDADDWSHPERLARQAAYLDEHKDVFILGTWFSSMDETLTSTTWENKVESEPDKVKAALQKYCCIGHPTVMMRRRVVESMGGYDESPAFKHAEDYEFWLRASKRFKIANLPELLLKYREYPGQVSKLFKDEQRAASEAALAKHAVLS